MGTANRDKRTNRSSFPGLFTCIFGGQLRVICLTSLRMPLAASLLLFAPLVAKPGHASSAGGETHE
jgi:hypothetical protein